MMMNTKKPQLEDGFSPIAHGILENLSRTNLSSYQSRVVYAIFRKTYGWHKKEDFISISQLVEMTGIHKSHISRTKKELIDRGIVTSRGNKIGFQKDSSLWLKLPVGVTAHSPVKVTSRGNAVTSRGNKKLPVGAGTKDNKNTITKDNSKEVSLLIELFSKVNPSYKRFFANKTERACSQRLIEQYGMEKLTNLMNQLPVIITKPYAPTITSPFELEVKMGKLIAFMQKQQSVTNRFSTEKL